MAHRARRGDRIGAALLDLSTGEFTTAEYVGAERWQALNDELTVLRPREIVVPADVAARRRICPPSRGLAAGDRHRAWHFELESGAPHAARAAAHRGLEGFGLDDARCRGVRGRRALVHYLRDTQKADLAHVRAVTYKQATDALLIDPGHARALESWKARTAAARARCSTSSIAR